MAKKLKIKKKGIYLLIARHLPPLPHNGAAINKIYFYCGFPCKTGSKLGKLPCVRTRT